MYSPIDDNILSVCSAIYACLVTRSYCILFVFVLLMTEKKFSRYRYIPSFFLIPVWVRFQKIMKKFSICHPRVRIEYHPTKCVLFVFVFANKMASSDKETVLCFFKRDFVCAAAERKNKIRLVCVLYRKSIIRLKYETLHYCFL